MKEYIPLLFLLTFQGLLPSFMPPASINHKISSTEGFALVELYTSEGCSSCPPADEAVGRLNGWKNNVYILSFHVDYWNYLGWKDAFSNASYSNRQQDYGTLFHLNSVYTPQIIVNGKSQFVGSDETRLRETIESSLKEKPNSQIYLKIPKADRNKLTVSCTTEPNPELKLGIALVQNFTKDFIQKGENKGQTLHHYFTVRDFQSIPNQMGSNTTYLNIPNGLPTSECSVVAFLQNPKTGHIVAATQANIP